MCCAKWSSVINLIYSGQELFSYTWNQPKPTRDADHAGQGGGWVRHVFPDEDTVEAAEVRHRVGNEDGRYGSGQSQTRWWIWKCYFITWVSLCWVLLCWVSLIRMYFGYAECLSECIFVRLSVFNQTVMLSVFNQNVFLLCWVYLIGMYFCYAECI